MIFRIVPNCIGEVGIAVSVKKAWNSAQSKSKDVLIKSVRRRTDPTNRCSIALRIVLMEHIAVEHAVLDGFLDVLRFDFGL